jgi:hypothetical protein
MGMDAVSLRGVVLLPQYGLGLDAGRWWQQLVWAEQYNRADCEVDERRNRGTFSARTASAPANSAAAIDGCGQYEGVGVVEHRFADLVRIPEGFGGPGSAARNAWSPGEIFKPGRESWNGEDSGVCECS